jgi:hypothetical protein
VSGTSEHSDNPNLYIRCPGVGREYFVRRIQFAERGPRGAGFRAVVFTRSINESEWVELPMKLTWWSRVAHSMFTTWPPENVDSVHCEDGCLTLFYRDYWVPYEKPIMPFALDRESAWRAEYLLNRAAWKLYRIRHLDYEERDTPPA